MKSAARRVAHPRWLGIRLGRCSNIHRNRTYDFFLKRQKKRRKPKRHPHLIFFFTVRLIASTFWHRQLFFKCFLFVWQVQRCFARLVRSDLYIFIWSSFFFFFFTTVPARSLLRVVSTDDLKCRRTLL